MCRSESRERPERAGGARGSGGAYYCTALGAARPHASNNSEGSRAFFVGAVSHLAIRVTAQSSRDGLLVHLSSDRRPNHSSVLDAHTAAAVGRRAARHAALCGALSILPSRRVGRDRLALNEHIRRPERRIHNGRDSDCGHSVGAATRNAIFASSQFRTAGASCGGCRVRRLANKQSLTIY